MHFYTSTELQHTRTLLHSYTHPSASPTPCAVYLTSSDSCIPPALAPEDLLLAFRLVLLLGVVVVFPIVVERSDSSAPPSIEPESTRGAVAKYFGGALFNVRREAAPGRRRHGVRYDFFFGGLGRACLPRAPPSGSFDESRKPTPAHNVSSFGARIRVVVNRVRLSFPGDLGRACFSAPVWFHGRESACAAPANSCEIEALGAHCFVRCL